MAKTFSMKGLAPEDALTVCSMILYCNSQLRGDTKWMELGKALQKHKNPEQIQRLQVRARNLMKRVEAELKEREAASANS